MHMMHLSYVWSHPCWFTATTTSWQHSSQSKNKSIKIWRNKWLIYKHNDMWMATGVLTDTTSNFCLFLSGGGLADSATTTPCCHFSPLKQNSNRQCECGVSTLMCVGPLWKPWSALHTLLCLAQWFPLCGPWISGGVLLQVKVVQNLKYVQYMIEN